MLDPFFNLLDVLTEFIKTSEFKTALITFEWIFYILSFTFIGLSIWLRYKSFYYSDLRLRYSYYRTKPKKKADKAASADLPLASLKEYWEQLILRLNYQDDAQWKLAVIEADNFFDHILNLLGYQGESMGERLQKVTPEKLKNINEVWQVHKIRNALVHDTTFKLSYNQAESVIRTYERALKEFKILE